MTYLVFWTLRNLCVKVCFTCPMLPARCKDFVDFQIELLIKTDSFELRSIDCDWTREYQIQSNGDDDEDIDFVYRDMYLSDSDNMFDGSNDDNVKLVKNYTFSSSLCFTQMRSFCRFCACCLENFLMYFVSCTLSRMISFPLLNRLNLEKCHSVWNLAIAFSILGCLLKWINLNMKNFISWVLAIEQRASFLL